MKIIKYSVMGLAIGSIGFLFYKNHLEEYLKDFTDNIEAKRKKLEINQKAEEFLIKEFIDMVMEKSDITLDEAILKFENADEGITLEEFAETKMRSGEVYRETYKPYFSQARDKVIHFFVSSLCPALEPRSV